MLLKRTVKTDFKKALQTIRTKLILLIVFIFIFLFSQARDKAKIKTGDGQTASIGIHIMNIYQVDLATNSFFADFYLWCRWTGDIDPLKNIEFLNSEEQWGFSKDKLYNSAMLLAMESNIISSMSRGNSITVLSLIIIPWMSKMFPSNWKIPFIPMSSLNMSRTQLTVAFKMIFLFPGGN